MNEAVTTRARGGGFSARIILILVLAAVFSMSAMAVLSAYAPELRDGDDGGAHALSKSAVGYAGVVRLLRKTDRSVVLARGPLASTSATTILLVLTPPHSPSEKTFTALRKTSGSLLVVLPKWVTQPDPLHEGWVRPAGTLPSDAALSVLPDDLRKGLKIVEDKGQSRPVLRIDGEESLGSPGSIKGLRTFAGPGWIPAIVDPQGRAVLAMHEDSGIYVLSDPDLLNTQGLATPGGARIALDILDTAGSGQVPVAFDLTLNGFSRPRSVLRLMLEPPLLGFTLCLFVAVLLVGWQAMVRFGPHRKPGRAVALGKRALADNTAGLIGLARKEHSMAAPYATLVRTAAARAVAAPRDLSDARLTALLDRLAERGGSDQTYAALAEQAGKARTPVDLMTVARSLYRWKTDMTHGRKQEGRK